MGLPLGAFVGFVVGTMVGLPFVEILYLIARLAARLLELGKLNDPLRRPDFWMMARTCPPRGWCTRLDGNHLVRDCLFAPPRCPRCNGFLTTTPSTAPTAARIDRKPS